MSSGIARSFSAVVTLSLACASLTFGQHPSGGSHRAPQGSHEKIVGSWEGTFQMQSTGGMELVVARDSVWRVKMQLIVDHPFPPLDVRDFKVDGKTVTWVNDLMGTPCKATATLDDNTKNMKGEMVCDARTLTFALAKK